MRLAASEQPASAFRIAADHRRISLPLRQTPPAALTRFGRLFSGKVNPHKTKQSARLHFFESPLQNIHWMNKPRMPKELIPLLEKLFVDAPVVELPAHIDHAFGRESFVYWIDQGILATCAPRTRGPRMTALFVPRTILGGPKALLHKRPLELTIRTLSPVRLRRRDALQFRRFLADHPGIELEYLRTLAWNHEAQLDGLLVNGLDPVPVRLARLFLSLLAIGGEESSAGLLPIEPTVDELALMVHATRAVVNRLLSDWIKRGLIERNGRKIIVLPNFKAAFESSLAL